ncbi:hypothetical protein MKW98_007160, partial [Papaver atlanticum]
TQLLPNESGYYYLRFQNFRPDENVSENDHLKHLQFFDRIPPPYLSPFVDNKKRPIELYEGIISQPEDTKTAERKLKMDIFRKTEDRASGRLPYSAANQGENVNIVDGEMRNYQRATEKSATDASKMTKREFRQSMNSGVT